MARVLVIFLSLFSLASFAGEIPSYISGSQRATVANWLAKNPSLRVATDTDCNCSREISHIRRGNGGVWKPNPSYHPFFTSGDFNGDGKSDFAVVLIDNVANMHLAVFNGPIAPKSSPVFLDNKHSGALFYGPPRPKPYHLVIGEFGSEGAILKPKGKSYVLVLNDCC